MELFKNLFLTHLFSSSGYLDMFICTLVDKFGALIIGMRRWMRGEAPGLVSMHLDSPLSGCQQETRKRKTCSISPILLQFSFLKSHISDINLVGVGVYKLPKMLSNFFQVYWAFRPLWPKSIVKIWNLGGQFFLVGHFGHNCNQCYHFHKGDIDSYDINYSMYYFIVIVIHIVIVIFIVFYFVFVSRAALWGCFLNVFAIVFIVFGS